MSLASSQQPTCTWHPAVALQRAQKAAAAAAGKDGAESETARLQVGCMHAGLGWAGQGAYDASAGAARQRCVPSGLLASCGSSTISLCRLPHTLPFSPRRPAALQEAVVKAADAVVAAIDQAALAIFLAQKCAEEGPGATARKKGEPAAQRLLPPLVQLQPCW